MSRTLTALALIITGCIAFAGLSAFPGCGYQGPSAPEGFAPPPGETPKGGLKIEVPVKPPLADRNGDGVVSQGEAREDAKTDFRDAVKTGSGWIIGLIGLATVAMFAASFFISTIPRTACGVGIGLMGAMWLARYMLLAYGTIAADIVAWACLGLLGISLIGGAWTLALWWKRWILLQQGKSLTAQAVAKGESPRDGVALMAAGSDAINAARKGIIQAIDAAKGSPHATNVVIASLKDKGVNL